MKKSDPLVPPAGPQSPGFRLPDGRRANPAPETSRMHAGRLALVATLGLVSLPGCGTSDKYDDALTYPVRSDLLVADMISQIQPTGFNPPGRTPTDALRLPAHEVSSDVNVLRGE